MSYIGEGKKQQELIKRLKKREDAAFEELIDEYGGIIYKVLHTYVKDKNNVDDIFQDVFIKIYKNINTFREESKLSVWIYQVALNTVRNFLRKKCNKDIFELQDNMMVTDSCDDLLDNEDLRGLLERYIDMLPENWQTVLNLYYFNSYSYNEISEITGFPVGTVKTYLYRSKEKLSVLMARHKKELI